MNAHLTQDEQSWWQCDHFEIISNTKKNHINDEIIWNTNIHINDTFSLSFGVLVFIQDHIKFNNDSARMAHFISFYLSTTIPHIFFVVTNLQYSAISTWYLVLVPKFFFYLPHSKSACVAKNHGFNADTVRLQTQVTDDDADSHEFLTQLLLYLSVIVSNNVAYPVVVISCSTRVKRQCKSGRQDMGDDFIEKGEVWFTQKLHLVHSKKKTHHAKDIEARTHMQHQSLCQLSTHLFC